MPRLRVIFAVWAAADFSIGLAQGNDLSANGVPLQAQVQQITLDECVEMALRNNRSIQIERLNPVLAKLWLDASYSYYDPLFTAEGRRDTASDTGGFDPADFSRDAVFSAKSEIVRGGITGFLPTGLSYALTTDFAHSYGERNFLNFDSYKIVSGVSVRQPLLRNFWIDEGRLAIKINKKNLQITELGVIYIAMDVVHQLHQAYFEFVFAKERARVQLRLLDGKQRFLSGIRRQVQVGTMTRVEEKLAQSQAAQVNVEQIAAENVARLAEHRLRTLLGHDLTNYAMGPLEPAETLIAVPQSFSLDESWRLSLEHRPDLAQLRHDVERADINVKYRRNQLFPSLDVVAGYGRKGASAVQVSPPLSASASASDAMDQLRAGDAPSDMVGLIFSIPLGRTSERASYRASKEVKAQAALYVKQKEELILQEVADAISTAKASLSRLEAAQLARLYAQEALGAEEQRMAQGNSTVFVVLQLQDDLANAESAELRARADYNQAIAQLRFSEGTILDYSRIAVHIQ